mgnify:FL=1
MFRNFDNEIWHGAIYQGVDYSWRFEVSTFGRIRSAITGKIYSCGYGAGGYQQVCISVFGRRLNVRIHRCVAETFIPNPIGYEIVNHIDGCKQHNWADNLEWCTRQENYFHAVDLELIDYDVPVQLGYLSHLGAYAGSCNGMSKLTEDDVREIRMNYIPRGSGVKCNRKELANQYGVSANLISKIVSGQIWTHV